MIMQAKANTQPLCCEGGGFESLPLINHLKRFLFPLLRGSGIQVPATAWAARFDLAVLHGSLSLGDSEVAIGQYRSKGLMVATEATAQRAGNVVVNNEVSVGPPLPP